ncbi:squamous cell carcinoma antigen recognized by T-cells 3-like isoform X2 [Epargyreus clarus]|uniref:squamous cell carcinoma antigen recognized by T-cells 3-like isoform X2 n=1 Tax=Epargyreus clarus TaxID=520877 RepID=UPI003C2DC756
MAIVEDGVRHESEEENEVVLEEDHEEDGEQDSDSSDDEDDDDVLVETKISLLEQQITQDPYSYDDHIELIQILWSVSDLERWRGAFDRLQQVCLLRPEHWLLRLQTEMTLAHSAQSREHMAELFQQASLDCYSIPILSEWCSWSLSTGDPVLARAQLSEVVRRAGADPFSGKLFWDAKLELEKAQMDSMNVEDPQYKEQRQRVLWCLEEAFTRPLLRSEEAWQPLQDLALMLHDQEYLDKIKQQHEVAVEYLQKISPFEDKLLTTEDPEDKCKIYLDYIDVVKELSHDEKYVECDSEGILKVLYDRASSECSATTAAHALLLAFARHAQATASRASVQRVLDACVRRCPRRAAFWTLKMQQAEHEERDFEEIKSIFETALTKGMETYKDAEMLWLSYLEYTRRLTVFDNPNDVDRLRRTFRLAWDSLAVAWGEEANDCEIPLYWARLEYKRIQDPKQGKEIFEEIFKYGQNKTLSKYWEALIQLEQARERVERAERGERGEKTERGERGERRIRELCRRALRCVADYPPAVARLWLDFERDYGELAHVVECRDMCATKVQQWRENYQTLKEKMLGQKTKLKNKPVQNKKKPNPKKKSKEDKSNKVKRKSDETAETIEVKRKKDKDTDVGEKDKDVDTGGGQKRPHEDTEDKEDEAENKRQRTDTESSATQLSGREACTLFVSNLAYDVNEENLREKLSEYGEIVSLRVRTGVKAFGGSICYCQYKTSESVEEALKHDRVPLDGRPMFLSRYSASKSKQANFKYPVTTEKNKLFVKQLPFSYCKKEKLTKIFKKYGKLNDIRIVTFKNGNPKGLAYVEYEDEAAAAAALEATNGMELAGRKLDVAVSAPPPRAPAATPASSLGQGKRDTGGGTRRTQLSSFIPSVLQLPSTSKANGDHANGEQRPLSNKDFRDMLLKN